MADPHSDGHAGESHAHHLPDPSIFPLILSIGMTFLAVGLVLGLIVFIAGLVIFAIGLGGWLYEDTQTHLKDRRKRDAGGRSH